MTVKTPIHPDIFFQKKLQDFQQFQDQFLNSLDFPDEILLEATNYVMQTPGKKFRAMLVYACGQLFELSNSILNPIALSIELIHSYSLVHDDLPAMDNDDYRRGRLSCHKAFNEATAILTGSALNHLAFSLLLKELPPLQALPVTQLILNKIGPNGVLSGQSLDLRLLQNKDLHLEQLEKIHYLKTTTLLEAAILSVVICANASVEMMQKLQAFAHRLGLAYQMLDDYGDIYAAAQWGKHQSSDLSNQKTTFAQFFSQKTLKKMIQTEFQDAKRIIQSLTQSIYLIDLVEKLEKKLEKI